MQQTPTLSTLKKYGLTEHHWLKMYNRQKGLCQICFGFKPLVVDHMHVRNFKKLPPEQKRLYVRGLLCNYCNHRVLRKGVTTTRLKNAYTYMKKFDRKLLRCLKLNTS